MSTKLPLVLFSFNFFKKNSKDNNAIWYSRVSTLELQLGDGRLLVFRRDGFQGVLLVASFDGDESVVFGGVREGHHPGGVFDKGPLGRARAGQSRRPELSSLSWRRHSEVVNI